jgi:hypothetical protein
MTLSKSRMFEDGRNFTLAFYEVSPTKGSPLRPNRTALSAIAAKFDTTISYVRDAMSLFNGG